MVKDVDEDEPVTGLEAEAAPVYSTPIYWCWRYSGDHGPCMRLKEDGWSRSTKSDGAFD